MNGPTLRRKVTITNPQGFHFRPVAAFARLARQFQSQVTLAKDGRRADGKSELALLSSIAALGLPGSELVIEVSGADAPAALDALAGLLAAPSADDAPEAPPAPPGGADPTPRAEAAG